MGCWINHLKPNYLNNKAEVVLYKVLYLRHPKLQIFYIFFFLYKFPADQLEELLQQLEKEKDLKCEEASKEFNNVRSQVEYNRHGLEQRQKNIEALVAEVWIFINFFETDIVFRFFVYII